MVLKNISTETKITSPNILARILSDLLKTGDETDREKEHFWVIGLDTQNTIKYIELSSLGILNETVYHPRETYRLAIMKSVNSIIVAHNHPSGNLEPSQADINMTNDLQQAGKILSIKLLDSLIINIDGGYRSIINDI